ncbi:MAG: hypothetical protein AAGI69_17725 [Cyanobacteria bacterium P01_H01_bin.21]
MNFTFKKALNYIGFCLCLVSTFFVSKYIQKYISDIDYSQFGSLEIAIGLCLILTYGAFNLILAIVWKHILNHLEVKISSYDSAKIYGRSQLIKYVPGNILHLTGRQALGMSIGLPSLRVAKSIVLELGLSAFAGCFFFILVLPLRWAFVPAFLSTIGFVAAIVGTSFLVKKLFGSALNRAFLWQLVFLTLTGLNFVVVLNIVTAESPTSLNSLQLSGAYTVAWLIGLVTPGAPAGAGIRELVLMFLLGDHYTESKLLASVLLTRLITIGGDLVFFLAFVFIKQSSWGVLSRTKTTMEPRTKSKTVLEETLRDADKSRIH